MSSLSTALRLRTPILWAYAPEPFPWIDRLIEQATSPLFVYDPASGLLGYDPDTSSWKLCVHVTLQMTPDGPEPILAPLAKMPDAVGFVADCNGTMILYAGDKVVDDFLGIFHSVHFRWRNSFQNNTASENMPQFVLLAPTMEIPPHMQSFTALIDGTGSFGTPQLVSMIDQVNAAVPNGVFAPDVDPAKVTAAASGLSEQTTIDTLFSSLLSGEEYIINPDDVIERKTQLLKASTTLDYHRPKITINDVAGLDNAKTMIRNSKWILDNPEEVAKWGLSPLRRFLLIGLPGCGKSMISEAAAAELKLDLVKVGVARSMNKFIGESERNIREMFDQIERLAPIVAWDDEIGRDLAGGASSNYTDGGTTSRVHGEFLTRMQELNENVFFFGAANGLEHLAPEMLRAGRWDKILYVGFPSAVERHEIFRLHLSHLPGEYDIDRLVSLTSCWTGAEIANLIHDTKNRVIPTQRRGITTEDIVMSISTSRNRIWLKSRTSVIESYKMGVAQYEWASSAQLDDARYIIDGKEPGQVTKTRVTIG